MTEHLCQITDLSNVKLSQLLYGRSRQSDSYRCGGCLRSFETICVLHLHCMKHNEGGSYYFDHVTSTAYPKYDTKCSYAQVDLNKDLESCQNYRTILKACPRSINDSPQLEENTIESDEEYISDTACDVVCNKEESDKGFTQVLVKNIKRAADNLITFEMNEKDSHLFNATANVIMEQVQQMGNGCLEKTSELQVMVPINGNTNSMPSDTQIEIFTDTSHSGVHLATSDMREEADHAVGKQEDISHVPDEIATGRDTANNSSSFPLTANCEGKVISVASYVPDLPFVSWKELNENRHKQLCNTECEGITDVQKDTELLDDSQDKTDELQTEVKPDLPSPTSIRPVRTRKPNSRLCTYEWETTYTKKKKVMRIKNESKFDQVQTCHSGETTDESPQLESFDSSNEAIDKKHDDGLVSTDAASSDDISASKVLLSLSKGGNEKKNSNDIESSAGMTLRDRKNIYSGKKIEEEFDFENQFITYVKQDVNYKHRFEEKGKLKQDIKEHVIIENRVSRDKSSVKSTRAGRNRKDFVCKTCGKVGNKAMIEYHKQSHRKDLQFKCEICEKGFKTKPCYTAHLRQHGERKYKCDQCPAAFFRKQYLDTHKRKHTGEVPYMCDLCGSGFMEVYILQRHINNKHKQERKYACNICDVRFFRADTRDNHQRRHYEPTLKCAYCEKMFKAELDRRKHELTHTGDKQVFCPLCNYGFAALWSYYRHMWNKHSIKKEEAKEIRVKNPDLVFMRKRNVEYQSKDKPVTGPREPVHKVGKSVAKSDTRETEKIDIVKKLTGLVYEVESSEFELVDSDHLEGVGYVQQSDLYEDASHNTSMFVDATDISDAIVLQDGQGIESRNTLLLGEGNTMEATTNISIVLDDPQTGSSRSMVVLSDYSQSDIDEYTKQYSAEDI